MIYLCQSRIVVLFLISIAIYFIFYLFKKLKKKRENEGFADAAEMFMKEEYGVLDLNDEEQEEAQMLIDKIRKKWD